MRHATIDDLPTIVAIYNSTVARRTSTADTEEVSVASKLEWFNSHNRETRPILVHEENGDVAAWVSFESFYGRPAYSHTTEISILWMRRAEAKAWAGGCCRKPFR